MTNSKTNPHEFGREGEQFTIEAMQRTLTKVNFDYNLNLEYIDSGGATEGIDGYIFDHDSKRIIRKVEIKRWSPAYVTHYKRVERVIDSKQGAFDVLYTSMNLDFNARRLLESLGIVIVAFDYNLGRVQEFAERIEQDLIQTLKRLGLIHLVMIRVNLSCNMQDRPNNQTIIPLFLSNPIDKMRDKSVKSSSVIANVLKKIRMSATCNSRLVKHTSGFQSKEIYNV